MKNIVRLEALRFKNVKNVKNGTLYFCEQKKLERGEYDEDSLSSVLGIYGQNGSGKTTALDALRMIQIFLSSSGVGGEFVNLINAYDDYMSVGADFFVKIGSSKYYVYYDIQIKKNNKNLLHIESEKLSYFKYSDQKKNNLFEFQFSDHIKDSFLNKLSSKDKVIYQYTASIETNSETNNGIALSSIFNRKLLSILIQNKESLKEYSDIVNALSDFGRNNLAIYSINYFNENESVGIKFRVKDKDNGVNVIGDMFVPFRSWALDSRSFKYFRQLIDQVNKVMPSIIPDYSILINETNSSEVQRITNRVEFILTSKRGNGKPIPLLYESNGIKKIISILSGLIDAYSNEGCLMAIDEIDSGIFEYLLGEIVYAFDNFGRGQLIFTSHNMRVLEKVHYKNIFFTTTDLNNAFIQLTNVRDTNNLRDMYYKFIANGYQEGIKLYDMVKTEELVNALYVGKKD